MHDEIYDRDYQLGRVALNEGIDRLVAKTMETFRVISAIQFAAPWTDRKAAGTGRKGMA